VAICMICREELLTKHRYQEGCEHAYHTWCFKQYLETKIQDGQVMDLSCPECDRRVLVEEVAGICGPQVTARMARLQRNREVANDPNRRPCPRPDCDGTLKRPCLQITCTYGSALSIMIACSVVTAAAGGWSAWASGESIAIAALVCCLCSLYGFGLALVHDGGPPQRAPSPWPARCQECHHRTCFACGEPWHPGRPCSTHELVDEWARYRDAMRCPRCRRMIERIEGCNHMSCSTEVGGCGYEFCWACGGPYDGGHFTDFGCPQYGSRDGELLMGTWLKFLRCPMFLLSGVVATEIMDLPPLEPARFICLTVAVLLAFMLFQAKWLGMRMGCFSTIAALALGAGFGAAWLALEEISNSLVALGVESVIYIFTSLAILKWRLRAEDIDCKLLVKLGFTSTVTVAVLEFGKGLTRLFTWLNSLLHDKMRCDHEQGAQRVFCELFAVGDSILAACVAIVLVAIAACFLGAPLWEILEDQMETFVALVHMGLVGIVFASQLLLPVLDNGPNDAVLWSFAFVAAMTAFMAWGYCIFVTVAPGMVMPGVSVPLGAISCLWLCRLMMEFVTPLAQTALLKDVIVLFLRSLAGFTAFASLPMQTRLADATWCQTLHRTFLLFLGLAVGLLSFWSRRAFPWGMWIERLTTIACLGALLSGQVARHFNYYVACKGRRRSSEDQRSAAVAAASIP